MKNYIVRYKKHEGTHLCRSNKGPIEVPIDLNIPPDTKIIFNSDTYFLIHNQTIQIYDIEFNFQYKLKTTSAIKCFDTSGKDTVYSDDNHIFISNIMTTNKFNIPGSLIGKNITEFKFISGKRIAVYLNKNLLIFSEELKYETQINNIDCFDWDPTLNLFICGRDEMIYFYSPNGLQHNENYHLSDLIDKEISYVNYENINISLKQEIKKNSRIKKIFKQNELIVVLAENIYLFYIMNYKIYYKCLIDEKQLFITQNGSENGIEFNANTLSIMTKAVVNEIFFISEIACYTNHLILIDRDTYITSFKENTIPLPLYEYKINLHINSLCSVYDSFALLAKSDLFINNKLYDLEKSFDEIFFVNNTLYFRTKNAFYFNNNEHNLEENGSLLNKNILRENENIIRTFTTESRTIFVTDASRVIDGEYIIDISCKKNLNFSYSKRAYLIHADNIAHIHVNYKHFILAGIKSAILYKKWLVCLARNYLLIFKCETAEISTCEPDKISEKTTGTKHANVDFSSKRYLTEILKIRIIRISNNSEMCLKLELIHAQEMFEVCEIVSCFNYQILLFIEIGNFETIYPKVLQQVKIGNEIESLLDDNPLLENLAIGPARFNSSDTQFKTPMQNREEKNFNKIFQDLKRVQIPIGIVKTYEKYPSFKQILLRSEDKYKLEYFQNEMKLKDIRFDYKQRQTLEQFLFKDGRNFLHDDVTQLYILKKDKNIDLETDINTEILFDFIRNSTSDCVPIYLIFSNLFSLAISFAFKFNLKNIRTIRKYLDDNMLFKHALLTYDLSVINYICKLLNKKIEFPYEGWTLRYKINEFLEDYKEALFWINDVSLEKEFIKHRNIFETSLECEFKEEAHKCSKTCKYFEYHEILTEKRPVNFYKKFYAENTTAEKALKLSLECKDLEMSINYAIEISFIDIICGLLKYSNICDSLKHRIDSERILKCLITNLEERERFNDLGNLFLRRGVLQKAIENKLKASNYSEVLMCLEIDIQKLIKLTKEEPWEFKILTFKERFETFDVEEGEYLSKEERDAVYICLIGLIKSDFENTKSQVFDVLDKYKSYFKKFEALKEFVEADEMSISSVSSISQVKGLKGIKRKLVRLKIKEKDLLSRFLCMHDICKIPEYKILLKNELKDLIYFTNQFYDMSVLCDDIIDK
ncbi:hypothetical protein CDIK_0065 [Cucumispora dikerogammari]|nr:hypothetical protein CDIK_0065 [Cucumispora dikerogammari]